MTPTLCCVHIDQLITYAAVFTWPFTLQLCCKPLVILQRVTKSWKAHISSHDGLQNFLTSTFLTIVAPEERKSVIPSLNTKLAKLNTKYVFYFLTAFNWPHKRPQKSFISHECFFDIDFNFRVYPITNARSIHWLSLFHSTNLQLDSYSNIQILNFQP